MKTSTFLSSSFLLAFVIFFLTGYNDFKLSERITRLEEKSERKIGYSCLDGSIPRMYIDLNTGQKVTCSNGEEALEVVFKAF